MTIISFARLQDERLNQEVRRTRAPTQLAALRPSAPPTINRLSTPTRLTREELRERYTKGLCWHYDESWSREHRCKKRRLLVIEPVEEEDLEHAEESLDHEEEDTEEEPQLADCLMHALTGYTNKQAIKVASLLKQQLITVLINIGSTNNFLNSKVATRMTLHIKDCSKFDVKIIDDRILKCDQRCL
ncbi:hypothetical protein BHE74_00048131 [Ensete ventricosum]|nr:hypothetical protein BHE74_00048131 [Ensete ventricosum]